MQTDAVNLISTIRMEASYVTQASRQALDTVLTDTDGFKRGLTIEANFNDEPDYVVLGRIRDYVNSLSTGWQFLDFDIHNVHYTMINNKESTVICTLRYYGIAGYTMDIYHMCICVFSNNGFDIVKRICLP